MEYVLIAIAVLVIGWVFVTYNKFVAMIEAVVNSKKEISVQLDRRGKVFDSLVSAVKRYMDHEESVFAKVTELRNQAKQGDPTAPGIAHDAEDQLSKIISSGELTSSLNITMEAYPELKANQNMLQLQEEIVATENKLTFAKKALNNSIEAYNVKKKSLPDLILPSIFSSLNQEFDYWALSEEEVTEAEARRVEF